MRSRFTIPSQRFRRRVLGVTVVLIVVLLCVSFRGLAPRRARASRPGARPNAPNILIIVGDDHAADSIGHLGDSHSATPRLDALARQGVSFRRAYCNAPVCTASRQSFITGRLPHAVGVTRLATPLPASAITLGDWMSDHGYATAAYGKMHFNSAETHGFVDRIDTPEWEQHLKRYPPVGGDHRKPWRPFHQPASVWLNSAVVSSGLPADSMEATFFADRAQTYLSAHKRDPFLLVVGFNEPHSPFKFPDDWPRRFSPNDFTPSQLSDEDRRSQPKLFREISPEQSRGIQAAYFNSVSFLDQQVGRILDALDANGLADNTIVVYVGDNGYMRGQHGRFEKHCFFEPAIRVPLIIRWPRHLPAGRQVDDIVELVDLMPTLLEFANLPRPDNLQGISLAALARGDSGAKGPAFVFSEYLENEEAMVRDDRYKLIVGTGRRKRLDGYETDNPTPGPYERLRDLKLDPEENENLIGRPELREVENRLRGQMFDRLTSTQPPDVVVPRGLSQIETIHALLKPRD